MRAGVGVEGDERAARGAASKVAPSEGAEVLSEAAAAEAAKKAEEARLIRLLESCHEERIRLGITAESQAAACLLYTSPSPRDPE